MLNEVTESNLASILKHLYNNAPKGEQVLSIHLFGVMYGKQIKEHNLRLEEIIRISGLPTSYMTEANKGKNLSKYAKVDKEAVSKAFRIEL